MSEQQPTETRASKEDIEAFIGKPIEEVKNEGLRSQGEQESPKVELTAGDTEEPPTTPKVPYEPALSSEAPSNANTTQNIVMDKPVEDVIITEHEKALFAKSLWNNVPFICEVPLLGGNFVVKLRSRTQHEQDVLVSIVDIMVKEEFSRENLARSTSKLQEYMLVVSVLEINGFPFPNVSIDPADNDLDKIRSRLDRVVHSKITPEDDHKVRMLLQCLQVFESKKIKMQEEALNDSFWTPAS
jgi:hypothetical protein